MSEKKVYFADVAGPVLRPDVDDDDWRKQKNGQPDFFDNWTKLFDWKLHLKLNWEAQRISITKHYVMGALKKSRKDVDQKK